VQIASGELDVTVFGQLAPAQLPLSDTLKPGPLEIVRLDAALGRGPLRQQALKHAPRHPDHAVVFADLDPELDGLLLGVPAGVLGESEEHRVSVCALGSHDVL
jgi:hypothetical protein